MVDILHSSAPADGDATVQATAETLTLHRDVASRWDAAGRLGVLSQTRALSAVEGHHDWIKRLTGLGTLGGGFGPQAWNLATQIAVSPQLLAHVSTQTRSLQVGELADLVQIVLEELELDGDGPELDAEIAGLQREVRQMQPKTAQPSGRPQRSAARQPSKVVAANKGKPAVARFTKPQAAIGKQAQLRELRRLVQQIRAAEVAAAGLPQADLAGQTYSADGHGQDGVSSPQLPTLAGRQVSAESSVGSARESFAQFGTRALPVHGDAGGSPRFGIENGAAVGRGPVRAGLGLGSSLAGLMARPARLGSEAVAHPLWSLAEASLAARAPRSLRWAEASTDRALLESPALADAFEATDSVSRGAVAAVAAQLAGSQARDAASPARVSRSAAVAGSTHAVAAAIWRGSQAQPLASSTRPAIAAFGGASQAPAVAPMAPARHLPNSPMARSSVSAPPSSAAAGGPVVLSALRAAAVRAKQSVARAELAAQFGAAAASATLSHWQAYFQAADAAQAATSAGDGGRDAQRFAPRVGQFAQFAAGTATSESNTIAALSATGLRAASGDLSGGRAQTLSGQTLRAQTLSGQTLSAQTLRARTLSGQTLTGQGRPEAAPGDLVGLQDEFGSYGGTEESAQGSSPQHRHGAAAKFVGGQASPGRTNPGLAPWWTAPVQGAVGPGPLRRLAAGQSASAATVDSAPTTARPVVEVGKGAPSQSGAVVPVFAGVRPTSSYLPGLAGLAAIGLGHRLDARASMGLTPPSGLVSATALPRQTEASWQASMGGAASALVPGAHIAADFGSARSPLLAQDGAYSRASKGLQSVGTGASATAGPPHWQAGGDGIGEWLDLGAGPAEGGFDAVSELFAAPASRQRPVSATPVTQNRGNSAPASLSAAGFAPAALAAQAAAVAVVRARSHARTAVVAGGGQSAAPSVAAIAGLRELGVLAARPAGKADALSAWVAQAVESKSPARFAGDLGGSSRSEPAARLRAMRTEQPGAGEWLDLGANEAGEGTNAVWQSASRAGQAQVRSRSVALAAARASANPSAAATVRRATPAALGADTPQALKAMLKAWGETTTAVPADAAAAFVARFLGRGDVARDVARRLADGATARRELVAPAVAETSAPVEAASARGRQGQGRPAQGRAAAARVASPTGVAQAMHASAQGDEIVLNGMAALAALTSGDLFGAPKGRERSMAAPDSPRELLAPGLQIGAQAGDETPAAGSFVGALGKTSTSAKPTVAASRALAGVQMHTFAPVGLGRGHNLVGQSRRARWLHATPRGTFATRLSTARSAARTGYGSSGFSYGGTGTGASELVGLSGGDGGWYLGETAPAPSALRGADRLSAAVAARRSASIGRSPGQTSPSAAAAPALIDGMAMPTDFRMGQDLVNPAAGLDAMVESAGRSAGATAAHKGTQAAAMTRVLSVTAAPTANMLPLVAPAAQAIVAAAAAKPLSEGIATSGGDPTFGTPIVGVGDHKAGKAGQGAGGDNARQQSEDQASNVQDIEALAVKVARSVMVRIKRERERRGLHV